MAKKKPAVDWKYKKAVPLKLVSKWTIGNKNGYNPNFIYDENDQAICEIVGMPLHTTLDRVDPRRHREELTLAKLVVALPVIVETLDKIHNITALTPISPEAWFEVRQLCNSATKLARTAYGIQIRKQRPNDLRAMDKRAKPTTRTKQRRANNR